MNVIRITNSKDSDIWVGLEFYHKDTLDDLQETKVRRFGHLPFRFDYPYEHRTPKTMEDSEFINSTVEICKLFHPNSHLDTEQVDQLD